MQITAAIVCERSRPFVVDTVKFIPRLVDLIVENKFPISKMVKFYDLVDINLAAKESSSGKPVLRMPRG